MINMFEDRQVLTSIISKLNELYTTITSISASDKLPSSSNPYYHHPVSHTSSSTGNILPQSSNILPSSSNILDDGSKVFDDAFYEKLKRVRERLSK